MARALAEAVHVGPLDHILGDPDAWDVDLCDRVALQRLAPDHALGRVVEGLLEVGLLLVRHERGNRLLPKQGHSGVGDEQSPADHHH